MIPDRLVTPQTKAAFLQALASTDTFTGAELALLKAEFEKPAYANLPTAQAKASTYNRDAIVPNPVTAAPIVPITTMSLDDFKHSIGSPLLAAVFALPDSPAKANLIADYNNAVPMLSDPVRFDNVLLQALIQAVIAAGIPQASVQALITHPDPNWTAKITVCPRTTVLAGQPHANAYVEAGDVVAALASGG